MPEPFFPEEAIAIIRESRWDPDATYELELLSGSFIWSDECYLEFVAACRAKGNRSYWDPVAYRASLILGQPREEYRPGWEELMQHCPDWPGFRPERRSEALRAELERALSEE
jgi:hypothetical protein